MKKKLLKLPSAPASIQKGIPLKQVINENTIKHLAENIKIVYSEFDSRSFVKEAIEGLNQLSILERGKKIASILKNFLPENYTEAVKIIIRSLTPPLENTGNNGLAVFFYLPHISFVAEYGLDKSFNKGKDPFEVSMQAQYELTQRFTAEFSIRNFLIHHQDRTFEKLYKWVDDPSPHVRRLCTEGTRPRLPWAIRIPSLVNDPTPTLPILEKLKDDESLYVRRSVANHIADIAKGDVELALEICERWLKNNTPEIKWIIRHALRYPAKKGNKPALKMRQKAR